MPSTPEAIAVHVIENLDAKLMMALSATRDAESKAEGNWTEYMKQFGGRLYRPDTATADVGEGEELPTTPEPKPAAPPPPSATPTPPPPAGPPILKLRNPLFEVQQTRKG